MNRLRHILTLGCVTMLVASAPVQAASLEDSMLKPPSHTVQEEEDTKRRKAKKASSFDVNTDTITTAAELVDLTEEDRIERIGQMCREDYRESGVLASVSAAQCILESGYLTTELATDANNCFGMKATLSGNDWEGSTWDGESLYTKETGEEYGGQNVTIVADFRKYDSVEASVADHSAYLLGASVDDGTLRYAGLEGETDYRRAIQIIKDGGYATDSAYVDKVCDIIERYDLTRFDQISEKVQKEHARDGRRALKKAKRQEAKARVIENHDLYRVRKSWEDADSQIGAFAALENARKACKPGYQIFDSQGNPVG